MPKRNPARNNAKRRKKTPQAAAPQLPPFTRGSRLSEPTDEPDLFSEFSEITDEKKRAFLAAMVTTPRVGKAARMAGITTRTAWNWRHDPNDVAFQQAYALAHRLGLERAESELWRRGVDGVEEPVYYQGRLVGSKKVYDTTASIFMLKGALPEKYRERSELSGPGGGPVPVAVAHLTNEALLARVEALRAQLTGEVIDAVPEPEPEVDPALRYAETLAKRNGGNGNGNG